MVREATENNHSSWELLERILERPALEHRQRSVERRIHEARFPTTASLESFDWTFNAKSIPQAPFQELATGEFLARRDNLVFVGKSGLGKSHLVQGIGRACCALGYRVRYATSAALLEELTAAAGDKSLAKKLRYYRSFDLLIIDTTAFVTNPDFGNWSEYIGDPPLVRALLDRVVDNAIVRKFEGMSYRKHRAEQKHLNLQSTLRPRGRPQKES
jgi:DNA replication protein DnaC